MLWKKVKECVEFWALFELIFFSCVFSSFFFTPPVFRNWTACSNSMKHFKVHLCTQMVRRTSKAQGTLERSESYPKSVYRGPFSWLSCSVICTLWHCEDWEECWSLLGIKNHDVYKQSRWRNKVSSLREQRHMAVSWRQEDRTYGEQIYNNCTTISGLFSLAHHSACWWRGECTGQPGHYGKQRRSPPPQNAPKPVPARK